MFKVKFFVEIKGHKASFLEKGKQRPPAKLIKKNPP